MTLATRAVARACYDAALAAVEPERLVRAARADLVRHRGPLVVVAAGKAALGMVRSAGATPGIAIEPHGGAAAVDGVDVRTAAHPLPDAASEAATRDLLALVGSASPETLVLVLLSGGASALLEAPSPGLTLDDVRLVTHRLLASGADIAAMNVVRRHCSQVKGGGLARAAAGAAGVCALVLSDVVGDDPAVIASGPTVGDPTTFADADAVLRRWLAPSDVPARVRAHVDAGMAGRVPETVKPGDPVLARVAPHVIAGNRTAVDAAAAAARVQGFAVDVVPEPLCGDATEAGRAVVARLESAPRDRPVAVILGGETTVRVVPGGAGGRSQQLALSAALALAGRPGVVLAAGTDGVDGPTDAAGACVDGTTVARARAHGIDAAGALARTDSHPCLDAAGDLVRTGQTGTNVADLVVALRPAC
jgi:glycerate-2-kinase